MTMAYACFFIAARGSERTVREDGWIKDSARLLIDGCRVDATADLHRACMARRLASALAMKQAADGEHTIARPARFHRRASRPVDRNASEPSQRASGGVSCRRYPAGGALFGSRYGVVDACGFAA
jgi:hypothetical protein